MRKRGIRARAWEGKGKLYSKERKFHGGEGGKTKRTYLGVGESMSR